MALPAERWLWRLPTLGDAALHLSIRGNLVSRTSPLARMEQGFAIPIAAGVPRLLASVATF